jgi:hypothetical protein
MLRGECIEAKSNATYGHKEETHHRKAPMTSLEKPYKTLKGYNVRI